MFAVPPILEAEAEGSNIPGMPELHCEFKVSLSNFVRPCVKI